MNPMNKIHDYVFSMLCTTHHIKGVIVKIKCPQALFQRHPRYQIIYLNHIIKPKVLCTSYYLKVWQLINLKIVYINYATFFTLRLPQLNKFPLMEYLQSNCIINHNYCITKQQKLDSGIIWNSQYMTMYK